MAGFLYPQAAELTVVAGIQTPYATGKLKLFKDPMTFNPFLAQADFAAHEATFTGYAAKTLAALPAPYPDLQQGGISFGIPTQTWAVGAVPTVFNDIHGGWVEDAGGILLFGWQISAPWPMQAAGDALPLDLIFNYYGQGNVIVVINGVPQ